MSNSNNDSRRSFLNKVIGGLSAAMAVVIGYPILRYLKPPQAAHIPGIQSIDVGSKTELKPNSGEIFKIGRKPGILIRTPQGEYRAFTAICTHLGCTVQYRSDLEQIWCACHNGHYDLQGRNVSGPPPKPLTEYPLKIVKGEIIVKVNQE